MILALRIVMGASPTLLPTRVRPAGELKGNERIRLSHLVVKGDTLLVARPGLRPAVSTRVRGDSPADPPQTAMFY